MTHILIVDDSPTELHVLRSMLERNGYKVSTAQTGEEGVEFAKRMRPDLILMDVVMPGLNGFQATRQLTKEPSTMDIPVIIVTTKDQDTDRLWAERQGAKAFIVKPAREKDLLERIGTALTD